MTDDPRRRVPGPLARYAAQIREGARQLEAEEQQQRELAPQRRRMPLAVGSAAAALAAAAVIVVLDTGRSAHADSIVNRAPAAAAASESVSFVSTTAINVGSHHLEEYRATGSIDFARRAFETEISLGRQGGAILQRRVGNRLYISQIRHGQSRATRWRSVRLGREPSGRFAAGPESEQFTSPPALLDGLASTRSPVEADGRETVERVPTNVYQLHTSLSAFLRAATGGRPQSASYQQVAATIAVALDGKGRPRRVTETFSENGARIRTTVTFSGYAVPVRIQAPPDSAVVAHAPTSAPEPIPSPSGVFERLLFVRAKVSERLR